MSPGSKQFNRRVLRDEALEQHVNRARNLRSATLAGGAKRLSATLGSVSRRLLSGLHRALHQHRENPTGVRRFGWFSAVSVAGVREYRPVRCK